MFVVMYELVVWVGDVVFVFVGMIYVIGVGILIVEL